MAKATRAIKTSSIPESNCPNCGYLMEQSTGAGTPSPGDLSVCLSCQAVLQFDESLFLRELRMDEWNALQPETRVELRRVIAGIRRIKDEARVTRPRRTS